MSTDNEVTENIEVQNTQEPVIEAQEQPKEQIQESTETVNQTQEAVQDWRDKEMARKHAQIKERDRELERIRKENEDLRILAQARAEGKEVPEPVSNVQNLTQEQIQAAARQLREQERYQEQLAMTNSSGERSYGDKWAKALDTLATFGTVDPMDMTTILNTDNPSKVLYELGTNPAEYQRLMDLPPAKRSIEIVKISMRETSKPKPNISNAPAPTEPVASRVNPEIDLRSEKTSDADWYAARQKAKAARFEQQRSLGRR